MLSPGKFHEKVPRERAANLRLRRKVLLAARSDRRTQRALVEACRRDILFFINVFVYQTNPRKKGREDGPFITWPFQDEAIRTILDHIERDEDLLIEKSREMGATWLCLVVQDWVCRFHRRKNFIDFSHNEKAVDNADDPNALFPKLAFVQDHLPGWMPASTRAKLSLKYPATRSFINGTSTSERTGVGGRATGLFLDEFSKQQNDFAILGQTADTGCRIFNGTHYGLGTAFYDLTRRPDLKKLILHWSQHPDKNRGLYRSGGPNGWEPLDPTHDYGADFKPVTDGRPSGGPFPGLRSPWYDRECVRRGSARDVAMHLDIDPQGSTSQFFDAVVIHRLRAETARRPLWEGELDHDRTTAEPRRLIERAGGNLRLWTLPDSRGRVRPSKYGAGCDIALGTGATPSVLAMGDALSRPAELVAEYANPHVSAEEFATLAVALCRLFHDANGAGALLCWENAGPAGKMFTAEVTGQWRYGNVYYQLDENRLRPERSDKPGWYPKPEAKNLLLEDFRAALVGGRLAVGSDEMLEECLAFQFNKRGNKVFHGGEENTNDPTAATVNHGDRVIAGGLMWKMLDQLGARAPESKSATGAGRDHEYMTVGWFLQERDRRRKTREAWGRAGYQRSR